MACSTAYALAAREQEVTGVAGADPTYVDRGELERARPAVTLAVATPLPSGLLREVLGPRRDLSRAADRRPTRGGLRWTARRELPLFHLEEARRAGAGDPLLPRP